MKEVSSKNFGLLIAFLLPGVTALWGASYFSETVRSWLGGADVNAPSVAGFLYLTLASVAAGIAVSTVRWMVVDTLHQWTGIADPHRDFSKLQTNIAAYDVLVEKHYRFYQHYGNTFVALIFVYVCRRWSIGFLSSPFGWGDVGFLLLLLIYYAGSRDTLRKYYTRTAQFLDSTTPPDVPGGDHPTAPSPAEADRTQ